MAGVNKAILIGNVGRDPEIRSTQSGQEVCNFSMATSRKYKKGDDHVEETEWHNIVAWGRLAAVCGQYLNKGSKCYVEGRIQTRKWQDKDGNDRYTTEVVAQEVTFLGGGNSNGSKPAERPAEDPSDLPF